MHDLELGDLQEVVTYGLAESIRDFFIGLMLGFFLRNVVAFFFCLTEDSVRPRYDDAARNCVVIFFACLCVSFLAEMPIFLHDIIGLN